MTTTPTFRGQMAYRAAESDGATIAVLGILEAPRGALALERLHIFGGHGGIEGFHSLSAAPAAEIQDPWSRDELATCDLNGVLTQRIWHRSAGAWDVLQLYPRGTSVAAKNPENEIVAFSGIAQPLEPVPADRQGWCDMTIDANGQLHIAAAEPRVADPFQKWKGNTHGSILSQPIWGWDDSAWGLKSTLVPGLQAHCQELQRLLVRSVARGETLSPEEDQRQAELKAGPAGGIIQLASRNPDPDFAKYVAAIYAIDGSEGHAGFSGSFTAEQLAARTDMTSRIIREIRNGTELDELVQAICNLTKTEPAG